MLNAGLKPACGELIEMARLVWEREADAKKEQLRIFELQGQG
jgi:hypothetical protein